MAVLGRIDVDLYEKILNCQGELFSRPTRLSHFCPAANSKFSVFFFNFFAKIWRLSEILQNVAEISLKLVIFRQDFSRISSELREIRDKCRKALYIAKISRFKKRINFDVWKHHMLILWTSEKRYRLLAVDNILVSHRIPSFSGWVILKNWTSVASSKSKF